MIEKMKRKKKDTKEKIDLEQNRFFNKHIE